METCCFFSVCVCAGESVEDRRYSSLRCCCDRVSLCSLQIYCCMTHSHSPSCSFPMLRCHRRCGGTWFTFRKVISCFPLGSNKSDKFPIWSLICLSLSHQSSPLTHIANGLSHIFKEERFSFKMSLSDSSKFSHSSDL
uniref:Uncharacterized protein n=1 Tax=Cacopsylla melanoneura TaxID=428564 RepID=A0A8D9BJS1_9HEMI